jgi:hypothetical protein
MVNSNIQIGKLVNYTNGNSTIYSGVIVKIKEKTVITIDEGDKAAMELWNAGYRIGAEISLNQLK